jgi:hypothetical protein
MFLCAPLFIALKPPSSVQNGDATFQQMWSKKGSSVRRPLHASSLGRGHSAGPTAAGGAAAATGPEGSGAALPPASAGPPASTSAAKPLCAKGGCKRHARAEGCAFCNVCCEEADKLRFLGCQQSPQQYESTCRKHKATLSDKKAWDVERAAVVVGGPGERGGGAGGRR